MAKGPNAFRTISEAADELGVPQHVLRFWETKFSFIRPMKRAGGRRFYRPQDIAVLNGAAKPWRESEVAFHGDNAGAYFCDDTGAAEQINIVAG